MFIPDVKDCVIGNKRVVFVRFQNNELIYQCENGFEFPVSVKEAEGGIFLADDKAIIYQRWIRKQIAYLNLVVHGQSRVG